MKKLLLLLVILLPLFAFSQDKVDKYCELVTLNKVLSIKIKIEVNIGSEKAVPYKDELDKVKKFDNTIDALNYMGTIGWSLVSSYPFQDDGLVMSIHYFFKKSF